MAKLTEEDWRISEEAKRAQEAATAPTPEQSSSTPSVTTPATAPSETTTQTEFNSTQDAAENAERQDREAGPITYLGQALDYLLTDGNLSSDVINGVVSLANQASGGNLQGLDDAVKSSGELKEEKAQNLTERVERLNNNEGELGDRLVVGLEGISEGAQAGVAMPFTVAARLANQASPWSNAPESIKNSALGESAFAITEIVVPTLLTGAVGGGYGLGAKATGGVALAAESALETATQESAEELLAGRTIAKEMGNIANAMGFDGTQLTQDLIEGNKPNAQAIVAITGFFQNLGLNWGVNTVTNKIADLLGRKANKEVIEEIATRTKTPKEDVAKQLDLFNDPNYTTTKGPTDTPDIDSMADVGKPSKGRKYINDERLIERILKDNELASDGMSGADRSYFTNWKAVIGEAGHLRVLQEAAEGIKRLRPTGNDIELLTLKAEKWLREFTDTATGGFDVDGALKSFPELLEPLNPNQFDGNIDSLSTTAGQVTQEGFIAGAVVAEELSIRLSQAARNVVNLETLGIDFTKAVENFLKLQDKAHTVLIPLRRGKRRWSVEGLVQQRNVIEGLTDPSDIISRDPKMKANSSKRNFETQVQADSKSTANTVKELFEKYQSGDLEAGQTLKTYMNLLAYTKPTNTLANVENLSVALKGELRKGSAAAGKKLYYSYMISRMSTQIASLSSSMLQLVRQPLGQFLNGNFAQAAGQFYGGWSVSLDGLQNGMDAFRRGRGMNSGSRFDGDVISLKQENQNLDRLWEGLQKQMNKEGAGMKDKMFARLHYLRQKMALMPGMDVAARALLAQDEWAKTVYAGQIAAGRAWQEAADAGWERGSKEFESLVQDHLKDVFKTDARSGISDPQVLEGAKRMTFQAEIPKNGNVIDKAFKGIETAAKDNEFWGWVSPFTRVTYGTLEQGGVLLFGSVPGGKQALAELIPRYKKTLAGEFGDVAKLELEGSLAFAQYWSYGVAALGAAGMVTGQNPPEGLPRTSFIVPAPGTEKGYIGIPYGRLEPIATPTSVIADLMTALKTDVISQGDYARGMERLLTGMALSTLDKSFTSSLLNTAELFDVRNWSDFTLNSVVRAGSAPVAGGLTGAYGGLMRMTTNWLNPSKTVTRVQERPLENAMLAISSNLFGGAGSPIMYHPLNGKPQMKTATFGGNDNWWGAVLASAANELLIPGKVEDADVSDIQTQFNEIGYDFNMDNLRTYDDMPLTADEISMLSKDINDYGQLSVRLKDYFGSSKYLALRAEMEERRNLTPLGATSGGTIAAATRIKIHQDIRKIEREAKEAAIRDGRLSKDDNFAQRRAEHKGIMFTPIGQNNNRQLPLVPTR